MVVEKVDQMDYKGDAKSRNLLVKNFAGQLVVKIVMMQGKAHFDKSLLYDEANECWLIQFHEHKACELSYHLETHRPIKTIALSHKPHATLGAQLLY